MAPFGWAREITHEVETVPKDAHTQGYLFFLKSLFQSFHPIPDKNERDAIPAIAINLEQIAPFRVKEGGQEKIVRYDPGKCGDGSRKGSIFEHVSPFGVYY